MQKARIVPQKLTLTTKGSFKVLSAKNTALRCGPHGYARTIQYTVTIGSTPALLDDRGFIVDWRDLAKAVAKKYKYVNNFISCEAFASEICDITDKLLGGRCANIMVDVGINGLPAHMTAEWERPVEYHGPTLMT